MAVTVPAGQPLERSLGGLPVTTAARRLPARLGAQQVPPAARHRLALVEAAAAIGTLAATAASRPPTAPAGLFHGGPSGRRTDPPAPRLAAPAMLRWSGVIQAVGAPIAVQFRGGHAPHRPLAWVGGDGAELGHQPPRRVQRQRALVDPAPPGVLPRHRPLPEAQVGVVGLHPAQVPLLDPAQQPESLGRLVGPPAGGLERMLGQHQPLPRGGQLSPTPPVPGQRRHLLAASLVVGTGLLVGLFGLGRPAGGQLELPRAIRGTRRAELGEAVAFGPQLAGGQPPHIHYVRGIGGQGLAAVAGQHPLKQFLRCPRLPAGWGCSSSGSRGSGPTVRYRLVGVVDEAARARRWRLPATASARQPGNAGRPGLRAAAG
jgi:hypothetical protein